MDTSGKRLLILGANRYNVMGIRAARSAGFTALVADRNPRAPGLAEADTPLAVDLIDVEGLAASVEQAGSVDGCVAMAEAGVRTAAALSRRFGLPSISEEAAANATSKARMRQRWAIGGRWSVPFAVAASAAEALRAADSLGGYPLIVKPDRSLGGSRGVRTIDCRDQVSEAFSAAQDAGIDGTSVVIEHCVEGTEYSCEVLIWGGEISVLCIGQKVKSAAPFRVDLSVQYPADLNTTEEAEVARMCASAVESLGLTQGVAHVEFAKTKSGLVLFELGARCGGGHTPQIAREVSGVDEFIEVCRMACGLSPQRFHPLRRLGADYRFLVFPPGRFKAFAIPEDTFNHPSVLDLGVTLSSGDIVSPVRSTSDRAGFLVTLGSSREDAAGLADQLVASVQVEYFDREPARPLPLPPAPEGPLAGEDVAAVIERYRERIRRHGVTFESMASGSPEKQRARHEIHRFALATNAGSVLDIGCGLGQFYGYLTARQIACQYTGYDIVPEYVAYCREHLPECRFEVRNILEKGIGGTFDTVVMSQVWNNRYAHSDNWEVLETALRLAYARSRVSVSVDLMSSYVDYQNKDLFYYSPEQAFRLARAICRRVVLRHDYRPYEFCLQLFHDEAEGFTG
jgi:biotin carboxylase/SAM-dependent methyltransferase